MNNNAEERTNGDMDNNAYSCTTISTCHNVTLAPGAPEDPTLSVTNTETSNGSGSCTFSKKRSLSQTCPLKSKIAKLQSIVRLDAISENLISQPSTENASVPVACGRTDTASTKFCSLVPDGPSLHINSLPLPLLLHAFSFLSRHDLLHGVCHVSRSWCAWGHDPSLWRRLCLRKYKKVDDSVLFRLTSLSENVQYLDISDTRLITYEGMVAALKNCPQLQVLKMLRCGNMQDIIDVFDCIAEHCPAMKQLYLDGCYDLRNEDLIKISKGCPKLMLLRVNQCKNISNQGIQAVAENCPHLVQITMDQCPKVTDDAIATLVRRCRKLEAISCMTCDLTDDGVALLAGAKELKFLEVSNIARVRNTSIMKVVKGCPKLESINVSLCRAINDACVEYIARHGKLIKSVYCVSCNLSDQALISLGAHSKCLEIVDVGWCSAITDHGVTVISSTCPTLTYLGLMRCDQVTISATEALVEQYPRITYSTKWLDCKRLLERARREGACVTMPDPGPPPAPKSRHST